SVLGLDKEPDLVHLEAHTPDGNVQYVTCRAQMCTEANRNYPFPEYIEISSLVVQDDYIFIQDLHIVSTNEKQVFAAVQEWNQNDTYNLYLSDTRGVYFTLAMENVKTTRGIGGNQMLDLYEVTGIQGMLIANKRQDNQVKTYITYNKGRDWRLLQAPASDLEGNDIHCMLPFCSLHLQLQMSENPYLSGTISTKSSAPGIIVATGNIGAELSYNNVGMFVSSDAGNSWRKIFEEEHNVWFLDKGGALVAVKQPSVPTRHLWISFDEGREWTQYSFSPVPLFVDGVLVEAGTENQIMTFFGHFSHRSEWQLIKIDYKSIYSRKCTEEDYQTWHLHNQGEPCVMGQKQIFMKRRPGNFCMLGRDYSRILSAEPCICRAHDFECDYGYERSVDGNCRPAFWFNHSMVSRGCSLGQNYFNSTGYRKVVLNNCTKGVKEMYTAIKEQCPIRPPKGLLLTTKDGKLTANLGSNVTFLVHLDERLPADYQERVAIFRTYCRDKITVPSHITNMDEIPLTFDIPLTHTVEKKGPARWRYAQWGTRSRRSPWFSAATETDRALGDERRTLLHKDYEAAAGKLCHHMRVDCRHMGYDTVFMYWKSFHKINAEAEPVGESDSDD
ncbi:VPS10 domain-containing receptor, partial [Takifugu flavidus]